MLHLFPVLFLFLCWLPSHFWGSDLCPVAPRKRACKLSNNKHITWLSSVLAGTSLIARELESPCSLKMSFNSSTSVGGTGKTYRYQIKEIRDVRMAERSKAPDSRIISFPVLTGPGLLVSKWRRGFESHFWHELFFFSFSFFLFTIYRLPFVFFFLLLRGWLLVLPEVEGAVCNNSFQKLHRICLLCDTFFEALSCTCFSVKEFEHSFTQDNQRSQLL